MATFQDVVRDYLTRTAEARKIGAYNPNAVACYLAEYDLPRMMAKAAGVSVNTQVALAPKTLELAAKFLREHEAKIYTLGKAFDVMSGVKFQHTPKLEGLDGNKTEAKWQGFTAEQLNNLAASSSMAPGLIRAVAQNYNIAALSIVTDVLYPLHLWLESKSLPGFLPRLQAAVVTNKAPEFVYSDKQTQVYFHVGSFDDYGNVPLKKQMEVLTELRKNGVTAGSVLAYRNHYASLPPKIQLNIGYLNPLRFFAATYKEDKEVIELLEKINGVAIYAKHPDMCRSAQKIYNSLATLGAQARSDIVSGLLRLGAKKSPQMVVHLAEKLPQLFDLSQSINEVKALQCRNTWQDAAKILPTLYVAWLKHEATTFRKELADDGKSGSVSHRVLTSFLKWCNDTTSSVQGLFSPAFSGLKKEAAESPVHAVLEFFAFIENSSVLKVDPELLDFILRTKPSKRKVRDFSALKSIFDASVLRGTVSGEDEDLLGTEQNNTLVKPAAQKPTNVTQTKPPAAKPSVKPVAQKPVVALKDLPPVAEYDRLIDDGDADLLEATKVKPEVLTESEKQRLAKRKALERENAQPDKEFFGIKGKPKGKRQREEFEPVSFDEDPDAAAFDAILRQR